MVAGANDKGVQVIVNAINKALNNYGKTIDLDNEVYLKQADDSKVEELVDDVIAGNVGCIVDLRSESSLYFAKRCCFWRSFSK